MDKAFELTAADMVAVELADSGYLNNKGANLYAKGDFAPAAEYYRLAAGMGNAHAVSNLGYCYLYGRGIEQNLTLAVAYFKIAAQMKDVDAAYKLGDIYGSDKWGIWDGELSVYYYRMAASWALGEDWDEEKGILMHDELREYPSLCYALGREMSGNGLMSVHIDEAYQFLMHARAGYEARLANGGEMYRASWEGVVRLMSDSRFDPVREKYDAKEETAKEETAKEETAKEKTAKEETAEKDGD